LFFEVFGESAGHGKFWDLGFDFYDLLES
jgi:hypothetical protein